MKKLLTILFLFLFGCNKAQTIAVNAGYTAALTSGYTPPTSSDVDTLSGQMVWQVDATSTIILSGSDVTAWDEKLAGVQNFAIASNRPLYYSTGGANNKPYIKINSGKTLTLTPSPLATSPAVYYMVVRTPSILTYSSALLHWKSTSGTNGLSYIDSKLARMYTGETPFYSKNVYNLNRTEWMLVKVLVADPGNIRFEVNNEPVELSQRNNGLVTNNYVFDFMSFSNYAGLEVAEIRLFNRVPDSDEDEMLKSYFVNKYTLSIPTGNKIIFLGDSHTFGAESGSPADSPYVKKFQTLTTSWRVYSSGVSGTCAVNNLTAKDLPDIMDGFNKADYSDFWVQFQYGTNDCASATAPYGFTTWAQWKTDYKAHIQTFITAGFDPQKIIIVTPPYSTGAYVAGNLSTCRDKILEIATELNLRLVDWYQLCVDAGLNIATMPGTDGYHGNDAFHTLVYDAIVAITGL